MAVHQTQCLLRDRHRGVGSSSSVVQPQSWAAQALLTPWLSVGKPKCWESGKLLKQDKLFPSLNSLLLRVVLHFMRIWHGSFFSAWLVIATNVP